jgi:hypothetical protein
MGSKSEALAKQFEAKARDAMTTAHHLATALGPISRMIPAVAVGQSPTGFDLARLDAMNAQHARDHADCTKAETIELHRKGVAMAAEAIRGLSDEQLAKGAPLMAGAPR